MNLLDLPDCMLEQVLEYLSFDEIAKQRIVCLKFNTICQGLLNFGFHKMMKRHGNLMRAIKAQLPRRESERRNHPLAKHSEILTCIETRISMLSMTYTKYIESNLCCFIPGKVIDEVFYLLDTITLAKQKRGPSGAFTVSDRPLRTHEILQELRDISSMAIDHFEDKILPSLRKFFDYPHARSFMNTSSTQYQSPPDVSLKLASLCADLSGSESTPTRYTPLQHSTPLPSSPQKPVTSPNDPYQASYIRMERKFRTAMRKLNNVISVQNRQARKLRNYAMQVNELNAQVVDLRRRLEETTNSTNSLDQIANANACSVRSSVRSNIKPRTATIILKRLAETPLENSTLSKKIKQQPQE